MDQTLRRRYERQATIIQAVAHPIRIAIVDLLESGEHCVADVSSAIGANRSNVSRHLAILLRSGIVSARKDGLQVYYGLRTPCVLSFLACAGRVLEQNVEEDAEIVRCARRCGVDDG
jgi:DNA-binding transcriptional ArsR family regulator